jgi:hypothetical protein
MPLGIHKTHLDFEILETGNPKTLVFVDSSQYIQPPDRPLLEVFLPGFNKYLLTNVVANEVNTFNASTLGLGTTLNTNFLQDLPDGVWSFRFKICPYEFVFTDKKHMRVTYLMSKLSRLYAEISIDGCECPDRTDVYIQKQLTRIHILIEASKSIVNIDSVKAFRYYQLANKLIDELSHKFCKNCKQWGADAGPVL